MGQGESTRTARPWPAPCGRWRPTRSVAAVHVAFEGAKFVTDFSRWVKGQAQGWTPGAFKLWVKTGFEPVQRPNRSSPSRAWAAPLPNRRRSSPRAVQ
jgi:hypothetical protein